MNELNVKLSPKEILNMSFNINTQGYNPKEVDSYLDDIIGDYNEFLRVIRKLERDRNDLIEDNNRLRNELHKLKMEFDTISEESNTGKFTSNNVDLLKRLSNLEKIVYGKNE